MATVNTGYFKGVEDNSTPITPITVHTNSVCNYGPGLKFYSADRRNLSSAQNNIFMTMNLPLTPTQQSVYSSNFGYDTAYNFYEGLCSTVVSQNNPYAGGASVSSAQYELCYSGFNQDRIVYFPITGTSYGELIVGHSINVRLPIMTGDPKAQYWAAPGTFASPGTAAGCGIIPCISTVELYASYEYQNGYTTYFDNLTSESSTNAVEFGQPMYDINGNLVNYNPYESNIVLLFSDFVRRPNNDPSKSWATQSANALINTNQVYTNGKDPFNYESLSMVDRNEVDVPVGLCKLDAGFCAITHPQLVDTFAFTGGTHDGAIVAAASGTFTDGIKSWATPNSGVYSGPGRRQDLVGLTWPAPNFGGWFRQPDSGFTGVYFTGGTYNTGVPKDVLQQTSISAQTCFRTVSTEYVQSITCNAEAGAWGTSTNPTWVEEYGEMGSNNAGVYVTKIGLWDDNHNLLGVAVPDKPILKTEKDSIQATINLIR